MGRQLGERIFNFENSYLKPCNLLFNYTSEKLSFLSGGLRNLSKMNTFQISISAKFSFII